jgi:hypothetical protein
MRPWLVIVLFVLCAAVSVPVVLVLDLSVERALVLAPVLVLGFAALAALVLLWTRIAWEQIRDLRR